jgi:hypothetical protein
MPTDTRPLHLIERELADGDAECTRLFRARCRQPLNTKPKSRVRRSHQHRRAIERVRILQAEHAAALARVKERQRAYRESLKEAA